MIHYVIHQLCHGQKVFVSVRRRTYRSSTHQKVRKYTEVGIFNPKTFSSFPETCKKMQNCINVTSLAAFQSADLLLNAVSESLRTGSGILKTLKDNRKIRGHFGFRTFEKKKTTARNGFSTTIQNDMPHTQNLPCLLQLSGHPNSANYSSKPRGSRSADTSFLFLFFFADT